MSKKNGAADIVQRYLQENAQMSVQSLFCRAFRQAQKGATPEGQPLTGEQMRQVQMDLSAYQRSTNQHARRQDAKIPKYVQAFIDPVSPASSASPKPQMVRPRPSPARAIPMAGAH